LTRARSGGSRFGAILKWVGIAGGRLTFGGAVYELMHAQGELRERGRIVDEQFTAGRAQEMAGDFPAAWESFAQASHRRADGRLLRQTARRPGRAAALAWQP
jgi:hypothetical protein